MGLPTVAAYIVLATLVPASLTNLGVSPIAAHLFIFYFAILSAITPPVCTGAYVAAGIAQARYRAFAEHEMTPGLPAELAAELGIAQRMIAYYEKQTEHPPTHLLPLLARTLRVSADELLGIQKPKPVRKTRDTRLWRRFSQIEKMGQQERRQVLQVLDAFIEQGQFVFDVVRNQGSKCRERQRRVAQ